MTENRHALKRFFGGVGRILSVTRSVLSALFSLVFILFFILLLGSLFGQQQFRVPDNGALRIEINGTLVDQRSYRDPLTQLINPNAPREYVVRELIQAIEMATANGPATLGPQAPNTGQLRDGLDADVLCVVGDPSSDVSVLAEPNNITHVFKGGVKYKG